MAGAPRVFNIPASQPFLQVLWRALLDGKLIEGFPASKDSLELARLTLYLPTRRAAKLARETFLECVDRDAAILPRIVPVGNVDEDEIGLSLPASDDVADIEIPDALGNFQRAHQ